MYEVIQNADDADYDGGKVPTLDVVVDESQLRFQSNECGFTEANVRALSDVDQSTKQGSALAIGASI